MQILFVILFFILVSCHEKVTTFTYTNPISSLEFRDPQILMDGDTWYAVGTCPPYWEGPNPGVKLYSSKDLNHWKYEKLLIDANALPDTVWYKDRFWAPELRKIGKKYFLTFNCRNYLRDKAGNVTKEFYHTSGVATADSIKGTYTVKTIDKPLTPFETNDLTLFEEDNKRVYAFFNTAYRDSVSVIYVAEMDAAACRLKEKPFKLLSPDPGKWDEIGIEGTCIIKKDNTYYLFYSSWTKGYAVGYATAKNIYGPWTKYENNPLFGSFIKNDTSFLYRDGKIIPSFDSPSYSGIGHNQVFVGPDGRYWTSYLGIIHKVDKAVTIIDPIWFEDYKIKTNTPTYTEQQVEISPSIIERNKKIMYR